MKRTLALGLLAASLALPAGAAEVGGVKLPDTADVGGQTLVLNGAGIRTKIVFKVYVGSLYVPARTSDAATVLAKAPRRFRLDLLRNLSADQLVDALVEGLQANTTAAEFAALKTPIGEMTALMKSFGDVKEGAVVTLDFVDDATRVALDGQPKGTIAGAPFNAALMRVWIGDNAVQGDLKRALLGER